MDTIKIARKAIELGYMGDDLAYIQEALSYYGVEVDITDDAGNTNEVILEVESKADEVLHEAW